MIEQYPVKEAKSLRKKKKKPPTLSSLLNNTSNPSHLEEISNLSTIKCSISTFILENNKSASLGLQDKISSSDAYIMYILKFSPVLSFQSNALLNFSYLNNMSFINSTTHALILHVYSQMCAYRVPQTLAIYILHELALVNNYFMHRPLNKSHYLMYKCHRLHNNIIRLS